MSTTARVDGHRRFVENRLVRRLRFARSIRCASVCRAEACKFFGDPTHDEVSSGTGQAPVSRARSATAGTATGRPFGLDSRFHFSQTSQETYWESGTCYSQGARTAQRSCERRFYTASGTALGTSRPGAGQRNAGDRSRTGRGRRRAPNLDIFLSVRGS
jgi:hypothetical protein